MTMTFRKLYWAVEILNGNQGCHLQGVYTSTHDLCDIGFKAVPEGTRIRLSLVKLDSANAALGTWTFDEIDQMGTDLQAFVETKEFTGPEVQDVISAFRQTATTTAA